LILQDDGPLEQMIQIFQKMILSMW